MEIAGTSVARLGAAGVAQPASGDGGGAVLQCLGAGALAQIQRATIGLAIWDRRPRRAPPRAIATLLARPPFCLAASGTVEVAIRRLRAQLPSQAGPILADIAALARVFTEVAGAPGVRLRLEHVADDACRLFHVDAVRLRLLCTYAGAGTEWCDAEGGLHRMAPMQVGLFKGNRHPDHGPRIRHRSPPVSHLPPTRRARLLLCIDETGVFE